MIELYSDQPQYIKLEQRLALLAWLNYQFGYNSNRELLRHVKQAGEGYDAEGRSFVYRLLTSRGKQLRIPLDDLACYEDNIRAHLRAVTARRPAFRLKYFQHLALLYTEVFLDHYFNSRANMLQSLNDFLASHSAVRSVPEAGKFAETDLS